MEICGKVKVKNPEIQVSASFVKQELVITTDEQYPQSIMIEFVQDKTELLDNIKIGDDVKVSINLGGREWINPQGETKYFNSIKGWRIEKINSEPTQKTATPQQAFEPSANFTEEEHDDLPF